MTYHHAIRFFSVVVFATALAACGGKQQSSTPSAQFNQKLTDVARPVSSLPADIEEIQCWAEKPLLRPDRAFCNIFFRGRGPKDIGQQAIGWDIPVREAANESNAKKPANEPEKPVAEKLTELDLASVKAARKNDRTRAEAMLREVAEQAHAATKGKDKEGPAEKEGGGELVSKDGIKPIFKKSGYEIPERVAAQYVAHEGKFVDRKTEKLHFEDKGRSLSTDSNERSVIAHMVDVAKAKNWGTLALKGDGEFRRQAWIASELAGVKTSGFRPKAQDRAMLEAARQDMRISAGERSEKKDNSLEVEEGQATERKSSKAAPAQEPAPAASAQAPAAAPAATKDNTSKDKESIGIAAARMVLERHIAQWPSATQEKCRKEFDEVIASAAAYNDRKVDLPTPKVSEKTVELRRSAQRPEGERAKTATPAQPKEPAKAPERAAVEPGIEMDR